MYSSPADILFDRKTAAKYLGLKNHNTLAVWDSTGRYDLQPIRVGGVIRYRKSVLDEFLLSRTWRRMPVRSAA